MVPPWDENRFKMSAKIWDYKLQEAMIFYHNTALKSSSVNKPSPKSIGGLIGLA